MLYTGTLTINLELLGSLMHAVRGIVVSLCGALRFFSAVTCAAGASPKPKRGIVLLTLRLLLLPWQGDCGAGLWLH